MALNANKYKNIIFDLGGVLLNIDYSLTIRAFSDLGFPDFKTQFSQAQQKKLFDLYETGHISSEDFRNQLKAYSNNKIEDSTVDTAWNAMLYQIQLICSPILIY